MSNDNRDTPALRPEVAEAVKHLRRWERGTAFDSSAVIVIAELERLAAENAKLTERLRQLDLQRADTDRQRAETDRMCRVRDARVAGQCRFCWKPIGDEPMALNFGREFAHERCLKGEAKGSE